MNFHLLFSNFLFRYCSKTNYVMLEKNYFLRKIKNYTHSSFKNSNTWFRHFTLLLGRLIMKYWLFQNSIQRFWILKQLLIFLVTYKCSVMIKFSTSMSSCKPISPHIRKNMQSFCLLKRVFFSGQRLFSICSISSQLQRSIHLLMIIRVQ